MLINSPNVHALSSGKELFTLHHSTGCITSIILVVAPDALLTSFLKLKLPPPHEPHHGPHTQGLPHMMIMQPSSSVSALLTLALFCLCTLYAP